MPTPLRLRPEGPQWPYGFAQLRADEPQLSISAAPHAGEIASWLQLQPPIVFIEPQPTAQPEHDPATHRVEEVTPVAIDGTWQQAWELIEIPPAPPTPDWQAFQIELLQSPAFAAARIQAQHELENELPTATSLRQQRLLKAATALSALDATILAAAADTAPFIGAWLILRQAGLVSPEVAAAMSKLATACHLPEGLIRSLGAPEQ